MRQLDGITDSGSDHEFEQTPGDGEGQGCLEYLPQSLGLESWTRPSDCTKTTKAY